MEAEIGYHTDHISPPLMCYTTTVVSHFKRLYYLVCGMKAREETKTVNLLSKKSHGEVERRRRAKANFSHSVVFGHRTEGQRHSASASPSLSLSGSLHHLHFSCLIPFTVFITSFPSPVCSGLGEGRGPQAAGGPVQRRCEPSNRLSLPSGTSHTDTQLRRSYV